MIKIFRKTYLEDGFYTPVVFHCPFCGSYGTFYSMSPHKCNTCEKRIPQLRSIITDVEQRIKFFHSGGKEQT